jgi:uncharacterized protein (DUF1697 family)
MTVYIALLRGINVGGKNMIKMAELKKVLEGIGLSEVQTYIQSGNVLFKSEDEERVLQDAIQKAIAAAFGFQVPVVLRTASELEGILGNCPFSPEEIAEAEAASDAESLYVAMLARTPSEAGMAAIQIYRNDAEAYHILGRDVYLLFRNSIRNSKLANNLQKLDASATTRNWKTMNKLGELAKDLKR